MHSLFTATSTYNASDNITGISNDALAGYPFTTSQLEAAYLTNQLLRLHPEEFRKLISLERSRQATLRWQFSSDPFDSVHEHQNLPYEMAMLASDEPRVLQGNPFIFVFSCADLNIQQNWLGSSESIMFLSYKVKQPFLRITLPYFLIRAWFFLYPSIFTDGLAGS